MAEFFHMGGYGFFIWSSYAVVAVVLIYHYFLPILKRKSIYRNLAVVYKGNVKKTE